MQHQLGVSIYNCTNLDCRSGSHYSLRRSKKVFVQLKGEYYVRY
jgi:hypothetical protein